MQSQPFWFLRNPYAWIVLVMSLVTAAIIQEAWVILVGVIGYQFTLLLELTRGRSLGRTGAIRLARAEQENRELRAEQARLLGAIREREDQLAVQGSKGEGNSQEPVSPPIESGETAGGVSQSPDPPELNAQETE